MNLKVSGFGAEPKKLAMLGGLVLVAGYFYVSNRTPGDSGSSSVSSPRAVATPDAPVALQKKAGKTRGRGKDSNAQLEFHPSLKFKDGEMDRSRIDPTLRLDLLEKVQNVKIDNVNRSLFSVLTAPAEALKGPEPAKIIPATYAWQGPQPPAKPQPPPPPPPAPPIPLKFYGFTNPARAATDKRAFFLDGDDIIVANEGQLVKNRYRIVRIGVNSADVEDTQFKNNKQTLPLVKEDQSS